MRNLAECLCMMCLGWNITLGMIYTIWRVGNPETIMWDLVIWLVVYILVKVL